MATQYPMLTNPHRTLRESRAVIVLSNQTIVPCEVIRDGQYFLGLQKEKLRHWNDFSPLILGNTNRLPLHLSYLF